LCRLSRWSDRRRFFFLSLKRKEAKETFAQNFVLLLSQNRPALLCLRRAVLPSGWFSVVKFDVEFYGGLVYTKIRKELNPMPNIKPVSDLRNYSEVLQDVAEGAPVFLTKNGRGKYAILDMRDYEKTLATIRLMNELEKGRISGETNGWLTLEAVEKNLGIADE